MRRSSICRLNATPYEVRRTQTPLRTLICMALIVALAVVWNVLLPR